MKRVRLALVAMAVAGAVTLAGCSNDDNATPANTPAPTSAAPTADLATLAGGVPQLSTLVAAVTAAGLVPTLQGAGPFTVFAPTNDAFAALPAGVVDKLLLPCNKDALVKVLTYHVLPQEVPSSAITAGQATTVEGQPVTIAVTGETVTVNGAKVVQADVEATNGVAHVIDAVLLPPGFDPATLKASC